MNKTYTRKEDRKILEYIISNKLYYRVKGIKMWEKMERLQVCQRSAQKNDVKLIVKGYNSQNIEEEEEEFDQVCQLIPNSSAKRDIDTISISSTDSDDYRPPIKLAKQQNCQPTTQANPDQEVQTTEIITENKDTMIDQYDLNGNVKFDWRLLPVDVDVDGTMDMEWDMSNRFVIPESASNAIVLEISEKHKIPLGHIHRMEETNCAYMLEYQTLQAKCENLLRLVSEQIERNNRQFNELVLNNIPNKPNELTTDNLLKYAKNTANNSIQISENAHISNKTAICETSEYLSLPDNEMNSTENSENIFYTAEIRETTSNSSTLLNNNIKKDNHQNANVSDDPGPNKLLSIKSEAVSTEDSQIAARINKNSNIFLPSNHI